MHLVKWSFNWPVFKLCSVVHVHILHTHHLHIFYMNTYLYLIGNYVPMQTQVHTYAARQISGEHGHLGYVLRGCRDGPEKLSLVTATLPNNNKKLEIVSRAMVYVYFGSNMFIIILVLLISVLFLHKKGHTISSSKSQSSFENYGLFWGCVSVSGVGNVLMTAHAVIMAEIHLDSGDYRLIASGVMVITQLVFAIFVSLIIAIYYGRKFSLEIPSIFILPFSILSCNCANATVKKIVQCVSIWSLLMFLLHASCRACFIFLALLSRPVIVISATLVYIFTLFYNVHLLAIIFAFTKAKKKQHWKTKFSAIIIELVQILLFVIICATATCFGSIIGYIGVLASYGAVISSPHHVLSILLVPSALAVFGWTLRKIGSLWMETFVSPNAAKEDEHKPLLQVEKYEEGCASNQEGSNDHRGRNTRKCFSRPSMESLLH